MGRRSYLLPGPRHLRGSQMRTQCSIPNCLDVGNRRGFCHTHYQRWRRGVPIVRVVLTEDQRRVGQAQRFFGHVQRNGACWRWHGLKDRAGYGRFNVGSRKVAAHRFAYEMFLGAIPVGLVLDHLCRVHDCVNPFHLEPVTNAENIRRGITGMRLAAITHCPSGHPYDETNTLAYRGKRYCRACVHQRSLARSRL